ncbi:MAG: ASCH domain-containing protein [Nocardioides sp.]
MDQLLALSVRQPWAHAIMHFGKDIENRTRRFGHRGLTLIHASASLTADEYVEADDEIHRRTGLHLPPSHQLERGGIVGVVEIVDSISAADARSSGPWWRGPYGLVLANARPLRLIPCKGTVAPLFWRPDAATLDRGAGRAGGLVGAPAAGRVRHQPGQPVEAATL